VNVNDDQTWQEQITDSQRTCLRLVGEGMSSKEIAQRTGLSHRTVDQYINQAARALGASNRREAARILASREETPLKKLQLKPEAIANAPVSADVDGVGQTRDTASQLFRLLRWIPRTGGDRHDLKPTEITNAIIRVSVVSMGAATGIIAVVYWLNRIFS
jgi:DNA-binding CsgD family transcriptional regulator